MVWCHKRRYIKDVPEFPTVKFELGWRNIVSKEIQQEILAEVKRISEHNIKIWIGVKWLATYIAIRPKELRNIKEGDFDLSIGVVNVKTNKESKPKIIPLLPEDIDLVKSFPTALPHLYFFRHTKAKGLPEHKKGKFSPNFLWSYWKKACKNLGIKDVDLYGGTKHSSATALRKKFSPEQIKKYGTKHTTSAAFDRYLQFELQDSLEIYQESAGGKKGEVVEIGKAQSNKKVY